MVLVDQDGARCGTGPGLGPGRATAPGADNALIPVDIDAAIVTAYSDKQQAAPPSARVSSRRGTKTLGTYWAHRRRPDAARSQCQPDMALPPAGSG